jgi:hypothetical protein
MIKKSYAILVATAFLAAGIAVISPYEMFDPYLPYNAIAAEPKTPYNLNKMPVISRTSYLPCMSCSPVWSQLPDIPSIRTPVAGPFQIPVPVP